MLDEDTRPFPQSLSSGKFCPVWPLNIRLFMLLLLCICSAYADALTNRALPVKSFVLFCPNVFRMWLDDFRPARNEGRETR
jgi:hypothetical protein